jgi:hypothetical protein
MEAAMTATQTVRTIDLGYEQMFIFDGGPQARVRVLYGAAWLTEEGEAGDVIAGAGDEVALHGGRALMEGLGPTRVQIVETRPPGLARRAAAWLRRLALRARRALERQQLGARAAVEPNA